MNIRTKIFCVLWLVIFMATVCNDVSAQGVAINEDGTDADPSAMLDVKSTSAGMLIPRMTESDRNNITSPATGLLIYQTNNDPGYYYYDGSAWVRLSVGDEVDPTWDGDANTTSDVGRTGNVGIGTTSPSGKLHIPNSVVFDPTDGVYNDRSIVLSESGGAVGEHKGAIVWGDGSRKKAAITSVSEGSDSDFVGLAFWTQRTDGPGNISESMRIARSGNVGIGTTSPAAQLHTTGSVRFANYPSGANGAIVRTDDSGNLATTDFTGNTSDILLGNNSFGSVTDAGAVISSCGTTNKVPKMISSTEMDCSQIFDDGTNVGIGTTSPSAALTINSGSYTAMRIENDDPGKEAGMRLRARNPGDSDWFHGDIAAYNPSAGSGYIGIKAPYNNTEGSGYQFVVHENGNVGIGTTTPSSKLEVSGNIMAFDGLLSSAVSYVRPFPSPRSADDTDAYATTQYTDDRFTNVHAKSDDSGPLTYSEAVEYARDRGGRLPTIEEIEAHVTAGSGSGYDNQIIWSQTEAGVEKRYVNYGKPVNFGSAPYSSTRQILDESSTAYVRWVADDDRAGLPVTFTSDNSIFVDNNISADGNLSADGSIQFSSLTNGFLQVDGSGNVSIGSGSDYFDAGDGLSWSGNTLNSLWKENGSHIYNGNSGNVGIGTTSPEHEVHISSSLSPVFLIASEETNLSAGDELGKLMFFNNDYSTSGGARVTGAIKQVAHDPYGRTDLVFSTHTTDSKTNYGDPATYTDNTIERIRITYTGNVGIGTSTPSYKLHVAGRLKTDGINETSDIRLKKNINTIEQALAKVMLMRGVTYEWKDDNRRKGERIGLIAQEVEKILPEVVDTDDNGYKSVQYSVMVALVIEALKEQQKTTKEKLDNQQQVIEDLQEQINQLKKMIADEE